MKLSDRIRIPEEVLARQVGEETVMLQLAKGTYFGLDPVGTRVWQLLCEGRTLEQACDVMVEEFDVSREDVERDLLDLAQDLVRQGLIEPA